ncbi:hypothetical protein [Clostridium kluyveri]|uniref:hypothetical protein n=1 Tax=Clostridium kluyveri TaxID=1534 RepID=UPI00224531B5|nr:hypothetical protein [Clostridium kluyveri]UZQ50611.1 hypothetical protein OP486_00030 [Clostridium kluyveri]UZQ51579.1 hypothetical protein OP486_05205 [Clostridium kluyveri]
MDKTYSDQIYSGTLATTSTTIATIAANTTFIMKGFIISNANTADKKAELLVNNIRILPFVKAIPTGDCLKVPMDMPVLSGQTIKLKGEIETDMDYYIWGVNEVTT